MEVGEAVWVLYWARVEEGVQVQVTQTPRAAQRLGLL